MKVLQTAWATAQATLRACGLVGWLGIGLLALALWTQAVWLPQRRAESAQLASDARGLRHALQDQLDSAAAQAASQAAAGTAKGLGKGVAAPMANAAQAWQLLWQALPSAASRVALPAAVLQAARQHGLQVSAVQYQGEALAWASQGEQTLWRQRMTMPVQGSAAAVHAWVADVLREPALSIESLAMQRDAATADAVTAQVSLSLWWKQAVVNPGGVSPVATAGAQP